MESAFSDKVSSVCKQFQSIQQLLQLVGTLRREKKQELAQPIKFGSAALGQ